MTSDHPLPSPAPAQPQRDPPPKVPKLKLKKVSEPLNLGDCMKIVGLHEKGYRAQIINGKGEVILVTNLVDPSCSSSLACHESMEMEVTPPPYHPLPSPLSSSRSLSPPSSRSSSPTPVLLPTATSSSSFTTTTTRSQSLPSPSRSHSPPLLSPRTFSRAPTSTTKDSHHHPHSHARTYSQISPENSPTSSPSTYHSTPGSPGASPPVRIRKLSLTPPTPAHDGSPPAQYQLKLRRVKRPSNNFYPLQGWVLWRKSIGQWEKVWLASKKSPTRVCFYSSENEDTEEAESVNAEDLKSLWAPDEESTQKLTPPSPIHFRLFTAKRTIYLIVHTPEKMRYWISGLKKLNPTIELDLDISSEPSSDASPLSPRSSQTIEKFMHSSHNFQAGYLSEEGASSEDWDV